MFYPRLSADSPSGSRIFPPPPDDQSRPGGAGRGSGRRARCWASEPTRGATLAALFALTGTAPAAEPPRYKFERGQELTYRTTYTFKYGVKDRTGEIGSRTDWTVWVVRPNPDGSHRLVIRQEEKSHQTSGRKPNDRPAEVRLLYADVFPDGRIAPNDTLTPQAKPHQLFPRLPGDAAEAAKGWSWEHGRGDRGDGVGSGVRQGVKQVTYRPDSSRQSEMLARKAS